jgi:hypothetical protein
MEFLDEKTDYGNTAAKASTAPNPAGTLPIPTLPPNDYWFISQAFGVPCISQRGGIGAGTDLTRRCGASVAGSCTGYRATTASGAYRPSARGNEVHLHGT